MHRLQRSLPARRRGVILLVVLGLLTLFAIVGISFALYAQSQAEAARIHREAEQPHQADVDPQLLLAYFLHQLLFGTCDGNGTDVNPYSALRGHDLMRNMFGGHISPVQGNLSRWRSNTVPFNASGAAYLESQGSGGGGGGGFAITPRAAESFDFVPTLAGQAKKGATGAASSTTGTGSGGGQS